MNEQDILPNSISNRKIEDKTKTEDRLMVGGFIAICLIIMQSFISVAALDPLELVSVIAFAIAIPLLASVLLVETVWQESYSVGNFLGFSWFFGSLSALTGIDAAFWHISMIAGIAFLGSGAVGTNLYFYHRKKYQKEASAQQLNQNIISKSKDDPKI